MGVASPSGATLESFTDNALGQRITRTVGTGASTTTTVSFFNTNWQVVEDDVYAGTTTTGTVSNQYTYVWGAGGINDLVARDDGSGNRLYALEDANGDVTALADASGAVAARFVYTPYGTIDAAGAASAIAYNWIYLWQMGRYDPVSGTYNFRRGTTARGWGGGSSRTTGAAYIDGLNLYRPMDGNPVGLRDPLSTDPFNDMWNDENAVWTDKTEYDDAGNAVETHVSIQQPDPGADPADSSPSYPDDPSAGQLLKQGA